MLWRSHDLLRAPQPLEDAVTKLQRRIRFWTAMQSLPNSLTLKCPSRQNGSWSRQIKQHTKEVIDLIYFPWLKNSTAWIPVSKGVNPTSRDSEWKQINAKLPTDMRKFVEKKATLLHYRRDHCFSGQRSTSAQFSVALNLLKDKSGGNVTIILNAGIYFSELGNKEVEIPNPMNLPQKYTLIAMHPPIQM